MPIHIAPSPIGGWNTEASPEFMDERFALDITNIRCGNNSLIHPGTSTLRTDITSVGSAGLNQAGPLATTSADIDVAIDADAWPKTLALDAFILAAGTEKLIAFMGGGIYEIDLPFGDSAWGTGTTFDTLVLPTTFTDDFRYVSYSHGGIIACNGVDDPWSSVGGTLSNSDLAGGGLTNSNDLVDCMGFKGRVLWWEEYSTGFYYPGAGEYKSTSLEFFDMDQFVEGGGSIIQGITWTRDGGSGSDDLAVFIFDNGETLVYQGSSPGSASDWNLVGNFRMGRPLGRKSWCAMGGDVLVATDRGIESMNQLMSGDPKPPFITDNIQRAYVETVQARKDDGSEIEKARLHYSTNDDILYFVFSTDTSGNGIGTAETWCMNGATGAWWKNSGLTSIYFAEGDEQMWYAYGTAAWNGSTSTGVLYSYDTTDYSGAFTGYVLLHTSMGEPRAYKQLTGISLSCNFTPINNLSFSVASHPYSSPNRGTSPASSTPPGNVTEQSFNISEWSILAEDGTTFGVHLGITAAAASEVEIDSVRYMWKQGGPV